MEKTTLKIEGVGEVQIEKSPDTHAVCEFCNEKVPFVFMRKIKDIPCCIECMHKMFSGVSHLLDIEQLYETFVLNE